MLASQLFGHVKGAFTGALANRQGAFRAADKGTLFLDEIGDMPLSLQATLLRALQTKTVTPLGTEMSIPIDVRIVAATHWDLWKMSRKGGRSDLFFRLKAVAIQVPPLREHNDDIKVIANSWLYRRGQSMLSDSQISQLKKYHWPGNGRQLINVLTRAEVYKTRNFLKILVVEPEFLEGGPEVEPELW